MLDSDWLQRPRVLIMVGRVGEQECCFSKVHSDWWKTRPLPQDTLSNRVPQLSRISIGGNIQYGVQ